MSYMAQKKNRILMIAEEKAEEYANMGYEITDENGRVVLGAALTNITDAKKFINELSQENESLKATLAEVKYQNEQLQKENDELKEHAAAQVSTTATRSATSKAAKKAE